MFDCVLIFFGYCQKICQSNKKKTEMKLFSKLRWSPLQPATLIKRGICCRCFPTSSPNFSEQLSCIEHLPFAPLHKISDLRLYRRICSHVFSKKICSKKFCKIYELIKKTLRQSSTTALSRCYWLFVTFLKYLYFCLTEAFQEPVKHLEVLAKKWELFH